MEKVIQSRIYIAFILSIRPILKFSRHRLENLLGYCLGRIMQHYYRLKRTHQDVGQMDMYIRMYDELKRSEGDNPTIGIVLCSDTDDDIARYSVMHGNEQLFASKYKLYLPTKEELKAEIETQKAMFYLQQQDNEDRNKNYTFNIE